MSVSPERARGGGTQELRALALYHTNGVVGWYMRAMRLRPGHGHGQGFQATDLWWVLIFSLAYLPLSEKPTSSLSPNLYHLPLCVLDP